jgi:two-component system OmpR family response regulator
MTARLAVVDDEPVFTEFIETLLRSRGYSVDTFNHGTALIDRLRAGYQPNLVLLDVMMPDIDGLETLRTLRQANPNVQVIMLSGRQAPATIVDALKLGAADYVVKPGDADGVGEAALEAAIRNALERQSLTARSPASARTARRSGRHAALLERLEWRDAGRAADGRSGRGQ